MKLAVEGIGFQRMEVKLLTGGTVVDWLIDRGKYSGQTISMISNPHWFAFNLWRLKGQNPQFIPSGLTEALRERWLDLYHNQQDRDVDETYLDRLDPSVPFDWGESPPNRGDMGLINESDGVDEADTAPLFD